MDTGSGGSWFTMEVLLWLGGGAVGIFTICVVLGLRRTVVVFRSYTDVIFVSCSIGGVAFLYILLFLFKSFLEQSAPAAYVVVTLVAIGAFITIVARTHADNADEMKTVAALIAKMGIGCMAVFVVWRLWDSGDGQTSGQPIISANKIRQLTLGAFILLLVSKLVMDSSGEPHWAKVARRASRKKNRKKTHWLLEKVE